MRSPKPFEPYDATGSPYGYAREIAEYAASGGATADDLEKSARDGGTEAEAQARLDVAQELRSKKR